MKLFTGLLALFATTSAPSIAWSLVADQFKCKISITNETTKQVIHHETINWGVRLPGVPTPWPELHNERASFSDSWVLEDKDGDYLEVHILNSYDQIMKLDSNKNPIQAKQRLCQAATVITERPCSPDFCSSESLACAYSHHDPFGPDADPTWVDTAISNGHPVFPSGQSPFSFKAVAKTKNGRTFEVVSTCHFLGTNY